MNPFIDEFLLRELTLEELKDFRSLHENGENPLKIISDKAKSLRQKYEKSTVRFARKNLYYQYKLWEISLWELKNGKDREEYFESIFEELDRSIAEESEIIKTGTYMVFNVGEKNK